MTDLPAKQEKERSQGPARQHAGQKLHAQVELAEADRQHEEDADGAGPPVAECQRADPLTPCPNNLDSFAFPFANAPTLSSACAPMGSSAAL